MSTDIERQRLSPGVYFGLNEEVYHRDPALGSSDLRKLARNPSDYWWTSYMNPSRPADKDTPSTIRGTAVHTLVLYGEEAFDRRYLRAGDHDEGMTPAEKAAITKEANKRAAAIGKEALPAKTYDNVAIASAMIARNPSLKGTLTGGLNEVSIFWTDPETGLPLKARIDCLKARGVGDLKSLVNKYDKPFDQACKDAIVTYRYDVQAKHYLDARAMIPALVADGAVKGDHDAALLKAVCASKVWAWQFIFWQAEGAPITHSRTITQGNPLLDVSGDVIKKAKRNFIEYRERFGETIWLLEEAPSELYLDQMPPWFQREA